MAAQVVSFANQKGGVGKTTSTLTVGHALAQRGARVLLVDMDPQASLTISCGVRPDQLQHSIYHGLFAEDRKTALSRVVGQATAVGCDLVPSSVELARAEIDLISEFNREQCLRELLEPAVATYDVVLIDCPPSLGLLTINALTASTSVIVPIQADFLALQGANLLCETIERVRKRLNPALFILGVLVTQFDKRTLHAREVSDAIAKRFGDLVFPDAVGYTVRLKDAAAAGESILTFDERSPVAAVYRRVAQRIMP
jgi:chromosome partitioning protein